MSNTTTSSAPSGTTSTQTQNKPVFYELSWENWSDSDGSFHKKILGKLKQIKLSEDDAAISAQGFFLAGKDSKGHDLFIARKTTANSNTTNFIANYLTPLSSAGEYHPADVTNCGRMIDLEGKEQTITSAYQVLVAKEVDLSTLDSLDGVYALEWINWNAGDILSSRMHVFQSGTDASGTPIFPCRAYVDSNASSGGMAIGSFIGGASNAHIPLGGNSEARTEFQLLVAQPVISCLSNSMGITIPAGNGSSQKPKLTNAGIGTVPSAKEQRAIQAALMVQIVNLAKKYDPTQNNTLNKVPTTGLQTAPYNTTYVLNKSYTLEFEALDAGEPELSKVLTHDIAPDKYVILSAESADGTYNQGNVYVGFTGTYADFDDDGKVASATDWALNLGVGQIDYPLESLNMKAHGGFMISLSSCTGHNVFNDSRYDFSLENQIFSTIKSQISNFIQKGYHQANIYLGGHSQGGAVATLMGPIVSTLLNNEFENQIEINIEVYTYGAPRSCNQYLASKYGEFVNGCFRYENLGDPVPMVPPSKFTGIGALITFFELGLNSLKLIFKALGRNDVNTFYSKVLKLRNDAETYDYYPKLNAILNEPTIVSTVLISECLDYIITEVESAFEEIVDALFGVSLKELLTEFVNGVVALSLLSPGLAGAFLMLSFKLLVFLGIDVAPGLVSKLRVALGWDENSDIYDWFLFFYWLFMQDYQHAGQLQQIINGSISNKGYQDAMNPSEIKKVWTNLNSLDFDQHSLSTYVTNLTAIVSK